jgi:hypothetical protein
MRPLDDTLASLGFPKSQPASSANFLTQLRLLRKRCGIYVLHFSSGEYYVGKSIDVAERYAQHSKRWIDISRLSFKEVEQYRLDDEERWIIGALEERGYFLRNKEFISVLRGESSFDTIMLPEEQRQWVNDLQYHCPTEKRTDDPDLKRRYRADFQRFERLPFAALVTQILRDYVRLGIPTPDRTEKSFWSCSCMPSGARHAFVRVNIYKQEVFTAEAYGDTFLVRIFLARSPLSKLHRIRPFLRTSSGVYRARSRFIRLFSKYPTLVTLNDFYKSGGQDQLNLAVQGLNDALSLLNEPAILSAIRIFNLNLMRKGANLHFESHCFDLADRIFS